MSSNFTKYRPIIEGLPAGTAQHPSVVFAESRTHRLYYTPFEHLNRDAQLVIVGITPGPTQLDLAYRTVRSLAGSPNSVALEATKRHGAFGGKTVRPNLVRMLEHFNVEKMLGLANAHELWDTGWQKFQATSVVPHAAFNVKRDGSEELFAGSFAQVLASDILRESFERDFLASVRAMNSDAIWVGLGPTPKDTLDWCAKKGLLRENQVAAFAHPSSNSGSQVKYFLREIDRASLKPRNPVLARCDWLDASYARAANVFAKSSGDTKAVASALVER